MFVFSEYVCSCIFSKLLIQCEYSNQGCLIKFSLRNRKHAPCFYWVIETRMEVWENEKCCGKMSQRWVFPQLFQVLPIFHLCFYNLIETPTTSFLFLLENTMMRKKKTTVCSSSLFPWSYRNMVFNQSVCIFYYGCFLNKF